MCQYDSTLSTNVTEKGGKQVNQQEYPTSRKIKNGKSFISNGTIIS